MFVVVDVNKLEPKLGLDLRNNLVAPFEGSHMFSATPREAGATPGLFGYSGEDEIPAADPIQGCRVSKDRRGKAGA